MPSSGNPGICVSMLSPGRDDPAITAPDFAVDAVTIVDPFHEIEQLEIDLALHGLVDQRVGNCRPAGIHFQQSIAPLLQCLVHGLVQFAGVRR